MTTVKQAERNWKGNLPRFSATVSLFTRTGNVEGLVRVLAEVLTPDEFSTLFATEFSTLPMGFMKVTPSIEGFRPEEVNA